MATKVIPGVALLPQINIITLVPKLVETAKRVRCFSYPSGEEMQRVVLWNFTHIEGIQSLLYAFTVGDGNPELVVSIWKNPDGTFSCEFGSQSGGGLDVYADDTLRVSVRGGSPGYFAIRLP